VASEHPGQTDPRDAQYFADLARIGHERGVALAPLGEQETRARTSYEQGVEAEQHDHPLALRNLMRSARGQGLLYSTELGFNISEEDRRNFNALTGTRAEYDAVMQGINDMRLAIESGASAEELAAIGVSGYRKAQEALDQARYDQSLAAQNANTQALRDLNTPTPTPTPAPAPGTGTGSAVGSVAPFTSLAEVQQYEALPAAEKSKWMEWHGANPTRTYADWLALNKPSGQQVFAMPHSVANPSISTSIPAPVTSPHPGVAYIPPAAGGQADTGSYGVFASQAEYNNFMSQPQYIKDRWNRYHTRYPNRTWAGFVQRGYPTLG